MQQTLHNPFSLEHLLDQVTSFYRLPGETCADGLGVTLLQITTPMHHYLKPNLVSLAVEIDMPRLMIDGTGWMDLGLSEVQSAALPIALAKGRVMTGGLGLGYYALAAAAKKDVDEVVVYERDIRVINWFTAAFRDRPEFEKIEIRAGDVRKAIPDRRYDSVFMDPYLGMLRNDVIDDIATFRPWVRNPDDYRFWGLEVILLDAVEARDNPRLLETERDFFRAWKDAMPQERVSTPRTEKTYRLKALKEMGRVA